ncbi:unnamed protein product [Effrenium voratum]|uniref:Uncharacterized protein n=1 Tax=Effrenium voratum TaxID=2562239 RepID=A0AA36I6K7_9DINO|nr:unnamed protein product [Effrenium voratum]
MADTKISKVCVITSETRGKHQWKPEVVTVQGTDFIKLHRWSRDLTRYVTGRALDLRKGKGHCLSGDYMEHLVTERNKKSREAYQEAMRSTQEGEEPPQPRRRRTVRQSDSAVAPAVVPAADWHPEREVQCLWSVKSPHLWLEMSEDIMVHLKAGIMQGIPEHERDAKKRKPSRAEPLPEAERDASESGTQS